MRKCKAGEGQAKIGLPEQLLREAERTTDEKDNMALSLNTKMIELFRKLLRGICCASSIQHNEICIARNLRQETCPLTADCLCLFRCRGLVLHALLANLYRTYIGIGTQTLFIFGNPIAQIPFLQLSRADNCDLHRSSCGISSRVTSAFRFVSLRS